ncbi:MAG: flagellar motor switch protein FliG [Deltaproteobacteria bacterium HGW-Deltaproteobacteria-6]|jgi:flagellar motor switch protein FliG|nr:MAG: flagellar motor switch protein FliG [Deltaproteobacteria bacterium HGW-Deltaproteobacteria-6]
MTGEEKAAILLLSLDEDLAASVMKNLRPSEIRRLGKQMGRVSNIPAETVSAVAKEFCTMAKEQGGMISVRDGASKNLMIKALGEKDAQTIIGEVDSSSFDNPIIEKLHEIDPKVMAEFTRTEHPQTIALILVHLKPEKAAEVLEHFSPAIQYEITKRMATLKSVPREFIDEVAKTLEKELIIGNSSDMQMGGVQVIADILNRMNRSTENAIMTSLEDSDPELASQIRNFMFSFEDVLKLDDKSLQELMKDVSAEDLSRALKMVDEGQREKIFKNMSKRGAEMLREEISLMPPIRISEVETSQRKIVETTKKLESEGRIVILRGDEKDGFV